MLNSSRKERSMNKQLILIVGGILLVGTFLVGAIWGWLTLLEYLIGVCLVTLIVFSRYALLKNYPLSTLLYFFFQAEDGIRYLTVTGVQTCALPILLACRSER